MSKIKKIEQAMKTKSLYYYLGCVLLVAGSVLFYVLTYFEAPLILIFAGIVLVLLSDKKWWIKVLSILLLPVISPFLFVISLFAFSDEAI